MPNKYTFSIKPIGEFVKRYLAKAHISADPFTGSNKWADYTNDLNPQSAATHHMDAEDFLKDLKVNTIECDLVLFDPPYSPRQISECYKSFGKECGMKETQNSVLYKRVRDAIDPILAPGGIVLSFGWNSAGMGVTRGYELLEVLMVCHGAAHNDTICLAERKLR